jgi:hypothetical protein
MDKTIGKRIKGMAARGLGLAAEGLGAPLLASGPLFAEARSLLQAVALDPVNERVAFTLYGVACQLEKRLQARRGQLKSALVGVVLRAGEKATAKSWRLHIPNVMTATVEMALPPYTSYINTLLATLEARGIDPKAACDCEVVWRPNEAKLQMLLDDGRLQASELDKMRAPAPRLEVQLSGMTAEALDLP